MHTSRQSEYYTLLQPGLWITLKMIGLTTVYCLTHAPISSFIEEHLGKWPGTSWFLQKRHSRSSHFRLASSRAPETQAGRGLKVAYLAAALSHITPFLKAPQPVSQFAQMCIHHTPGSGAVTLARSVGALILNRSAEAF